MGERFTEGTVIAVDKPYGMTSFGALAHVRYVLSRRLGVKKIKTGHAGTLDPLATGVLLICTGKATKRIEELQSQTKEYYATLQLGATTASYDREHTVNAVYPTHHITRALIEQTLHRFEGDIMQVPPEYSACKVAGMPAYRLMRKDREVSLQAKARRIDEIKLTDFDRHNMQATIRVVCSKGTYIRALARDIGAAMGSGAFIYNLRRTRIGCVTTDDCVSLDDFPLWLNHQLTNHKPNNTHNNPRPKDEAVTI